MPASSKRLLLMTVTFVVRNHGVSSFGSVPLPSKIMFHAATRPILVMSASASSPNDDDDMPMSSSKLEAAAVQRFTVGYDKLCKNCPTRLQPRVDTLTEMMLGVSPEERQEVWDRVNQRLLVVLEKEEEPPSSKRVQTSRDVYDFQTAGTTIQVPPKKKNKKKKEKSNRRTGREDANHDNAILEQLDANSDNNTNNNKQVLLPWNTKMTKARAKYTSHKQKLVKVRRLLRVTNALLSANATTTTTKDPVVLLDVELLYDPLDNAWYHDMDRLEHLTRDELKMERLKLLAQKARYESKVAKGRLKLYEKARVETVDSVEY